MFSDGIQSQELQSISAQKQPRGPGNETIAPGGPKPGSTGASGNAPSPHLTAGSTGL